MPAQVVGRDRPLSSISSSTFTSDSDCSQAGTLLQSMQTTSLNPSPSSSVVLPFRTQQRRSTWQNALRELAASPPPEDERNQLALVSKPRAMSLVKTPGLAFPASLQGFSLPQAFGPPPPVDLQGGTLQDVHQEIEIDPEDGARVEVTTYRILSADKSEEVTKTFRRKIKLECTQSNRRMEIVSHGKEAPKATVEEKTERIHGDIGGLQPLIVTQSNLFLDANNPQDRAITAVLDQTRANFDSLMEQEKEKLLQRFPTVFPRIKATPSTATEIITNPDGSTTTRVRSARSYSSHYSHQTTYVNGVRQMTKSKFRAFVQYAGPEGGFKVKLADNPEDELSEEEDIDDDNRSRITEIPDGDSSLVDLSTLPRGVKPEARKRLDKAWHAASELVDSEERYVEKLRLLEEVFRKRVADEGALEKEKMTKLFSNISTLYQFHNEHFLPQLMTSRRDWKNTHRICNVVRKLAPFLKMYSEYTNNYNKATKVFEEAMKKKKRFAQIVQELEKLDECDNLPLMSHLICPVQRVMRYQLLLQEYKKHLVESDADFVDAEAALKLVLDAAHHANELMKTVDRFRNVIEVQEQLGNSVSLVSPGRELLKKGTLGKVSSTTEKTEERVVFLFNDLLLIASERAIGFAKYKLRAVFDAAYTQICEGDNLEREHSFYIRGSDGPKGPARCVELFCETAEEKAEWMDAVSSAFHDAQSRLHHSDGSSSPTSTLSSNNGQSESKNCGECDAELGFLNRGLKCARCQRKFCKKCFGRQRNEDKNTRNCEACCIQHNGTIWRQGKRRNVLAQPANEKSLHASMVRFRGSMGKTAERFFVVRDDFCLYSYLSPKDECAVAMLPLPGCEVKMCGEKLTFTLRVGARRVYTIAVDDELTQAKWMAVLDLAANAQVSLDDHEPKK